MRRFFLILAALLLAASGALADAELVVEVSNDAMNVMVMDGSGQVISTVTGCQITPTMTTWTLNVRPGSGETATLYWQDENGNWINTGQVYPMAKIGAASTAVEKTPEATPTPIPAAWEAWPFTARDVAIVELPSDSRYQSRCGPSGSYHGAGAYKTYKMTRIQALYQENGYVYTDLTYRTVGRRMLYLPQKAFRSLSGVAEVTLSGRPARTTEKITPRFGPGTVYDDFPEAAIKAETNLTVFYEKDGWLFAEFDCGIGSVRAWVPGTGVEE